MSKRVSSEHTYLWYNDNQKQKLLFYGLKTKKSKYFTCWTYICAKRYDIQNEFLNENMCFLIYN